MKKNIFAILILLNICNNSYATPRFKFGSAEHGGFCLGMVVGGLIAKWCYQYNQAERKKVYLEKIAHSLAITKKFFSSEDSLKSESSREFKYVSSLIEGSLALLANQQQKELDFDLSSLASCKTPEDQQKILQKINLLEVELSKYYDDMELGSTAVVLFVGGILGGCCSLVSMSLI